MDTPEDFDCAVEKFIRGGDIETCREKGSA